VFPPCVGVSVPGVDPVAVGVVAVDVVGVVRNKIVTATVVVFR
jgi:hypothetical protein